MADTEYSFRSALSGYHKGDVIGYIEKAAAQHRSELLEYEALVTSLREENRSLQQQLNLLMMATPVVSAPAVPVEPVQPVVAEVPAPMPEPEPAPAPAAAPEGDMLLLELQAYRRAEAVERTANNRVRRLYQKIESLCDTAMDDFRAADTAVKQTVEALLAQTATLEQAYQTLSDALNASRENLTAINEQFFLMDSEEE